MAWLFLPHPHTLHLQTCTHGGHAYTHTHTHAHTPFWATEPPSDQPPLVVWSDPVETSFPQLGRTPSEIIPHCTRFSLSSACLTVGDCLGWVLSLFHLALFSFLPNQRVILIFPNPLVHSSVSLPHFEAPVFFSPDLLFVPRCCLPSLLTLVSVALLSWLPLSFTYVSLIFTLSALRSGSLGKSEVGGVVLIVVIPWRAGLVCQNSAPNTHLKCQSLGCQGNLKPTA